MSETSLTMGNPQMLYSLYDFKATYAKTISFKANEFFILQQANTKHKNWWEVINEQGDIGYIPSNYVETVTINPSVYIKFLDNALENLKKRDSEDMAVGTKTQVIARIMELKSEMEQIHKCHSSRNSIHNVESNYNLTHKHSELQINSKSNISEDSSNVVVEEPIRPITNNVDRIQKSIENIHEEIKSEIDDSKKSELQKSVINDSSLNVSPVITAQSVYDLVESVRINTNLSHEKSRVAVETVIQGLHELLPASIFPYLSTILSHCQSCLVVDDGQIEQTHDASRLKIIFNELTSCKEDSQQRSWMLHEDESVIKEYITELISILVSWFIALILVPSLINRSLMCHALAHSLSNADLSISRHVISLDQFHVISTLIQYYQMEVRWSIRQLLLQAFGVLCSLDKTVINIMLNSILPGELARDMMANSRNITKLNYSALLLTMIFSMGDPMPVTDLEYLSQRFLIFVLDNIESPPETDVDEQIPDLFLNFIISFNLQFIDESLNPVLNALERQKHAKSFCEKILLLINREENPITPVRQLARENNISRTFALKFVKSCQMRPYKMLMVQDLLEDDPDCRLEFCEGMMNTLDRHLVDLDWILFKDDCTLYSTAENPHSMRETQHTQFLQKLNVIGLIFLKEDPVKIFDHEPTPPNSLLKLFIDLFSRRTTADLFYTNDAKVLIDIIVRSIVDLSPGDQKRTDYLELSRRVFRNTDYNEHKHKIEDFLKCFTRILNEENTLTKADQDLVKEIFTEFPEYFNAESLPTNLSAVIVELKEES